MTLFNVEKKTEIDKNNSYVSFRICVPVTLLNPQNTLSTVFTGNTFFQRNSPSENSSQ